MALFVFDTDVVSTFAKIRRFDLFPSVFGKSELLLPPAVVTDIKRAKYPFLQNSLVLPLFKQIELQEKERILAEEIHSFKNLGKGESECIAIAEVRKAVFVSNDKKAVHFAESRGIGVVTLISILLYLKTVLSNEELWQLMNEIETKDKVVIVGKEKILAHDSGGVAPFGLPSRAKPVVPPKEKTAGFK
ncbi:hypothetical protein HZB01_04970 [Candidatus Woesearchaeota archaeon]|nr:hypothetical protein [Candidatus Woesearchaeota archaeon]